MIGPRANDRTAMLGCYSFPMHVGTQDPRCRSGWNSHPCWKRCAAMALAHRRGWPVLGGTDEDIAAAVAAARGRDVCVAVLGDRAGLFGRGTSGEGCDAADLRLPGPPGRTAGGAAGTGTPVVLVLLVGRPYELSRQIDRLAAVVCGFFPGEEGGPAIAGVLDGSVNPGRPAAGQLPAGAEPATGTYLASPLGQAQEVGVSTRHRCSPSVMGCPTHR